MRMTASLFSSTFKSAACQILHNVVICSHEQSMSDSNQQESFHFNLFMTRLLKKSVAFLLLTNLQRGEGLFYDFQTHGRDGIL